MDCRPSSAVRWSGTAEFVARERAGLYQTAHRGGGEARSTMSEASSSPGSILRAIGGGLRMHCLMDLGRIRCWRFRPGEGVMDLAFGRLPTDLTPIRRRGGWGRTVAPPPRMKAVGGVGKVCHSGMSRRRPSSTAALVQPVAVEEAGGRTRREA